MKSNKNEEKIFLTENEVAKKLNFSQRTLANWRKSSKGPPFKTIADRSIRYPLNSLIEWIENRNQEIKQVL